MKMIMMIIMQDKKHKIIQEVLKRDSVKNVVFQNH